MGVKQRDIALNVPKGQRRRNKSNKADADGIRDGQMLCGDEGVVRLSVRPFSTLQACERSYYTITRGDVRPMPHYLYRLQLYSCSWNPEAENAGRL